ncbi:MAG: TonB-dependent receptor, partial [Caulobacter sp.]
QQSAGAGTVEEVIVTGTNIATSNTRLITNPTPVDVLSEQTFRLTSGESVSNLLKAQPISVGAALAPTNNEYTGGGSSINLRGLGQAYTLVLVNGRRFGGEDIPDTDAVPAEGVASIEVLKNGASAIFGSDAIAGVVNVKLKDSFDGVEVFASYGNTTDGDASYKRGGAVLGKIGDNYGIVVSGAYEQRNGMTKWDRELTASRDYRARGGLDRRSTSVTTPNRVVVNGQTLMLNLQSLAPGSTATAANYVPRSQNQAVSTNEDGAFPPSEGFSSHWAAHYDLLDERLVLFTDGYFATRDQKFVALDSPIVSVTAPASNIYNPFGAPASVTYKFGPNEFGPITENFDTTNVRGTVGLRGLVAGLSYEAGFTRYQKTVKEEYLNDISLAAAQAAVSRPGASAFNPFGYYANRPEQLAGLSPTATYKQVNRLDTWHAKVSGDLFSLPAGKLQFAAGGEIRDVKYNFDSDAVWDTTTYWWLSGPRRDNVQSRDVKTVFAEMRAPLYDNPQSKFVSSAEVGGAIRYEDYSDFGDATVKQANGRIGFLEESLYLRASWAESFRAPSLSQLYQPQTRNTEPGGFYFDPVRNGNLPVDRIVGGNTGLQPERGESYNLGVVFVPKAVPRFSANLDLWRVEITDLIAVPDGQAILNGTSPSGTITRDPATQYPTLDLRLSNGGDRIAEGVDLGLYYGFAPTDLGQINLSFNATLTTKFEDSAGLIKVKRLDNYSAAFGPIPELRWVLGATWMKDGWEAGAYVRYTSGYKDILPGVVDRRVEAYTTGDLQVAYTFEGADDGYGRWLKNVRVHAGAENVWDEALPFVASSTDGWDRFLADFRGRYLYLGFSKRM